TLAWDGARKATIQVELTSKRYPQLRRGNFATLNDDDIGYFRSFLSSSQVCTDRTELDGYNEDWMHMCKGASSLVLKPKTTDDVSRIMAHCDKRHLAVVPQGGNTGLVGGSVPVFDEVVLSTALMNKILDLDEISGVVTCQAGCILETLDDHVAERGLAMPLDLGAKASCHIGGNVSTSAGGVRLIRYGSLHGSVLGLEAVLASGEVLDCMSGMRKDNTGYDLKQLLIGSEGTLGVVTKVAILCPSRPAAVNVALLACNSFADVLKTLQKGKAMLSEILSAFELIDSASMMAVEKYLHLRNPLSSGEFYCLVETSGSHAGHDEEKLTAFLDSVMEEGSVCDGTVAQGITQQKVSMRSRV
ncbi:PREDICTED: D-2-hydroxyglutarate dehydrogenase, mitochondrial-like, partial [Priapulus caudatus]|uniref:D-2-hydroxyglutarate dehydrogenase, mitochondrial n=1 Tax=Priapulus caudatus TaxID=37621 RepID=A0ABM1EK70_PRICU